MVYKYENLILNLPNASLLNPQDPKLYECPMYRKPVRTDQKYIGSIDFETDFNPKHWVLRGVALLCDIK